MSDNAKLTVFDVDFSNYEETEFEAPPLLPEDDYLMRLIGVEQIHVKSETSPNFGKPGFLVTLEVVNGPHAGAKVEDRLWVIEKALFRLQNFFAAFGIKVEKTKLQLPVGQVMNRTLTVTIKDGKPFGEKQIVRSEVKKYAHASKSAGDSTVKTEGDSIEVDDSVSL